MPEVDSKALIELQDKHLSHLRTQWMAATEEKDKKQWMDMINLALDGRIELMKDRDEATRPV